MNLHLKDFPTTRYQGSKRKIVLWIHEILKNSNIPFETVLDAFGGSASVSYLFKKMDKSVTYNDYLKFNFLIGKALIENDQTKVTDTEIEMILTIKNNERKIANTFDGIYYHANENQWIDDIVMGIETVFHRKKGAEYKRAIAYYALFQACMVKRPFNMFHRSNLKIRTADVPRSFGNKVTWEKSFEDLFRKYITEANGFVFTNGMQCHSLNKSAFDIDPYGYELVYLDPPYFAQNGSHETANYLKCYHFLEGIANYKVWEKYIDYSTTNFRFKDDAIINDFKERDVHNNIDELIERYRNSILIFSYKRGGLPSIEYIVKRMKLVKHNVFTKSIHYKYALNHQNGDAKKNREVLIIGY